MLEECCKKPNIAIMDHCLVRERGPEERVNRVCVNCFTHWYGKQSRIRRYQCKAWGAYLGIDHERRAIQLLEIERLAKQYFAEMSDPNCDEFEKTEKLLMWMLDQEN